MSKMVENKKPKGVLRFTIRNDAMTRFLGDPPSYRQITIELTEEQVELLALRYAGSEGGDHFHETISGVFWDEG